MRSSQLTSGLMADALSPSMLLLLLFLAGTTYLLSNRYNRSLHKIPGPWSRSMSTIPRIWSVYRASSHLDDINLHHKYGKIVRVAPTIFSISDTAEISHIYGVTTKFVKSGFYSLAEVYDKTGKLLPDPFVLRNKELHSRMKRNAANAYSLAALQQQEPYVDEVTKNLLKILDRHAETDNVCDIGDIAKNYAMDAVTTITFGRNFNYLEKGDTLKLYKGIDIFTDYMAIFGQIPWVHKYLLKNTWLADLIIGEAASQAEMVALSNDEIRKGYSRISEDGPMTFIQRLVLNQKANPSSITDHEMLTHATGNLAAGSDTTSTGIRAVIYYLLKNPQVYTKLRAKVDAHLTIPVSFADANEVPLIRACIQEAMRMHPPVGLMLGRSVPEGGAVVCGSHLPGGVEVGMSPFVLHYDPAVFPEPYKFEPERWLSSKTSDEQLKAMNRSYFPFGHGAHTCSGRHISMLEMMKMIPTLLLRYDMHLVNNGRDYKFKNRWFTPQEGLFVTLNRRS